MCEGKTSYVLKRTILPTSLSPVFPDSKPFEAVDSKGASTTNPWDKSKSNEVSVTFTMSSAAAKVLSLYTFPHTLSF